MFVNCYFMRTNKKKISNLFIVVILILYPSISNGQNPIFRQMYTQRYLTNPALVGNGSIEGIGIGRISSGIKANLKPYFFLSFSVNFEFVVVPLLICHFSAWMITSVALYFWNKNKTITTIRLVTQILENLLVPAYIVNLNRKLI